MDRAKLDAGNLKPDGMRRLAIVFGAVLVPKRLTHNLDDQTVAAEQLAADKKIKAGALAWVFPKLKKPLISSDGYALPGIIVWVKEVRRSKR